MNRILKKSVSIIIISLFVITAAIKLYPYFDEWITQGISSGRTTGSSQVFIEYRIRKNSWTSFPVKGRPDCLKITTYSEYALSPKNRLDYNILYEILDSSGHLLKDGVYYVSEERKIYSKKHTKSVMSNPFLLNKNRYLSPGYTIILATKELKKPSEIRLRWISNNEFISGVIVNVSKKNQYP